MLVQHSGAHVFEHRQGVGQCHFAGVVDLESQAARRRVERTVQPDGQRGLRRQGCENLRIFCTDGRRKIFTVGGRKSIGELVRQKQALTLAERVQQLEAQVESLQQAMEELQRRIPA